METAVKERNHGRLARRIAIAAAVVVVLAAAVIVFASNYLVDYAIGRSGDGGNREVALEVDPAAEGVELTIAENKATQEDANEAFLAANPGQNVNICLPSQRKQRAAAFFRQRLFSVFPRLAKPRKKHYHRVSIYRVSISR